MLYTYDEIEKIDAQTEIIPPCIGWFPTAEEIQEKIQGENSRRYVPFFIYLLNNEDECGAQITSEAKSLMRKFINESTKDDISEKDTDMTNQNQ